MSECLATLRVGRQARPVVLGAAKSAVADLELRGGVHKHVVRVHAFVEIVVAWQEEGADDHPDEANRSDRKYACSTFINVPQLPMGKGCATTPKWRETRELPRA